MTVWVCDWTHWQGSVLPAHGVADEGFGMVKLKVGGSIREGRFFEDPMFQRNGIALLAEPRLIPGAYWYLMPGRATAQAGLFYDLLNAFGVSTWAAFLDVEQSGVTVTDVQRFVAGWHALTNGQPLAVYTSHRFWASMGNPFGPVVPFLEEAHWVSEPVRYSATQPYASQQAKAINPDWWNVGYGGWMQASMLQFTDNALVQGKRVPASVYRGTKDELRRALTRT